MEAIKSTININADFKKELEIIVEQKFAKSMTDAVNLAIEHYIKMIKKEIYAKEMEEAKKDKDFMERTNSTMSAYSCVDTEGYNEW